VVNSRISPSVSWAQQIARVRRPYFQPIERLEQRDNGFFVRRLRRETSAIYTVVDVAVDAIVESVDVPPRGQRIIVARRRTDAIERTIEHAQNVGRFVGESLLRRFRFEPRDQGTPKPLPNPRREISNSMLIVPTLVQRDAPHSGSGCECRSGTSCLKGRL
jgi:hypothetical protein